MSLRDRMLKSSTIKETALLEDSLLFETKDQIVTDIPAINIALSGKIDEGMQPGLLQIAGESKRFKSKYALLLQEAFSKKFPDSPTLFYDSEFGTPEIYFGDRDISNIIHSPVSTIEELKHDISVQLQQIETGDKLFILLDSIGNLASNKETEDAISGKTVSDMTRAKAIKSLFRIIGPQLSRKNIYMVVINHTYKTMDMYPTDVVTGGSGTVYNSNGIWIVTASKNRDSERELVGFDFTIKVEKSRFVRQDSKIPITVSFESGVEKYSGLLDLAVEAGYILRPTKQTYIFADDKSGAKGLTLKQIDNTFYEKLLKETDFPLWIEKNFRLS